MISNFRGFLLVAFSFVGAGTLCAQTYPSKPVRILASEPGAQVDFTLRLITPQLSAALGQTVIVDNRSSGGFVLPEIGMKAAPDGYTLLMQSASFWIATLMQRAPYDPLKNFAPVTIATNAPLFLFTHPSLPARSVKELIALAKAKPGVLNYGSAGSGASNYLAAELFKSMAGVQIMRIPYRGSGQAALGLVANQVQMMFGSAPLGLPQVKTGKLIVLGVANAQPSPLAPEVPTIAAAGVPGYEAASTACIWVPAGTPGAVIARLNREIVRILSEANVKDKLVGAGIETIGSSPKQAYDYVQSDMGKWAKLIKEARLDTD